MENLIEAMKSDAQKTGAYDRYPVRFFSLTYSSDVLNEIMSLKNSAASLLGAVEIVDVKDLPFGKDAWLTLDRLRNRIIQLDQEKSFIVVGLSEYARFLSNGEFESLILSLLEVENHAEISKRRIYFPCFALYSQIQRIVNEQHKRKEVYNPFINETITEDLPRMFFINKELDDGGYDNHISSSAEWFGMWRNKDIEVSSPIICTSPTLTLFYEKASPDNVYNIKKIETYIELLSDLHGINDLVALKDNTEDYYKRLLHLIKDNGGLALKRIILNKLNAQTINVSNFYSLWRHSDMFDRWLLQNYVVLYDKTSHYLREVLKSLEKLTDDSFVETVYEFIFINKSDSDLEERRQLIQSINKYKEVRFSERMVAYYNRYLCDLIQRKTTYSLQEIDFRENIEIAQSSLESLKKTIRDETIDILTDSTSYERQLIIWLYWSKLLDEDDIKETYYDLWVYIDGRYEVIEPLIGEPTEKIDRFFDCYRMARLNRKRGDEYDKEINEWNGSEDLFYAWYCASGIDYSEVLLKKANYQGTTYVLDGVSGEFLAYISYLLKKEGYSLTTAHYSKAHLPTITSVAKEFYLMNNHWLLEYDQDVVHGETYYPVCSLEKALSSIKGMIHTVVQEDSIGKIAITSDHGSSVGHKLYKKEKKYKFQDSDHDGRCYSNREGDAFEKSQDYISYESIDGKRWTIALNSQSLNNSSKYMVHGGATPEEVLIPFIIANKGKNSPRTYKIKAEKLKVSGIDKTVSFKISPKPNSVVLKGADGTNIDMKYDGIQDVWYEDLCTGIKQKIALLVEGKEYSFETKPNIKMEDDLFDD